MNPIIIGFTGLARSGKGMAASRLVERHGFVRHKFADPLKNMLRAMLASMGADRPTIEQMLEGSLKEIPSDYFGGKSPRHAMQTLGTEWGRTLLSPNIWIDAWLAAAKASIKRGVEGIVADDVRFQNEIDAIRSLGGDIVFIDRPGGGLKTSHASEEVPRQADHRIANEGEARAFLTDIDALLSYMSWERSA